MDPEVLIDAFTIAAEKHPENLAVVDDAASTTYAELRQDVERLARGLAAAGLRHGDRFAIQLPNGIPWVTAFWGAAMAGCVVVPLNTRNRPAEIAYMLRQCEASAVLATDDADVPETGARVLRLGALDDLLAGGESVDPQQLAERRVATDADEVCLIQFTSGSTGYPKGAMLTHAGVLTDGHALRQAWRLEAGEALVVPSPLSHVLGLMAGCVVPALAGAALLTMANFDPARTLELIDRYRAVGTTGTPTHYLMLVEHPDRPRRDISSLRFAMYGGAPFTPEAARRVVADLGSTTLLGGFGMSETAGGVTSVSLDDPPEIQLTTVGRALPPFEVKVVDPETGEEQAPGEVGELWVRGRPVLKGYWGNPEETARVLTEDGWLRTGDLFSIGPDGYLRFAGRLKEMLTVGGYNVYPGEVERTLARHLAVAEAAVVSAPHERLGEVPLAFVRLHPGREVTAEQLQAFCRELLADYKVPRRYEFVDSFPISGSGKIEKFKLQEMARATGPA